MPTKSKQTPPDTGSRSERRSRFIGGWIGAVLAVTVGVGLLSLKFGLGLVHLSYDLPFAICPRVQPQQVIIVYMDDESFKELKQPENAPWDRALHARLLDHLTAEKAKGAAFDIVFSDPGPNAEADAQFARAIRANGKVALPADVVATGYGTDGAGMHALVMPYDPFKDAAGALGTAEMFPDDDLFIRRPTPMLRDDVLPSLAWAAAAMVGAEVATNDANRTRERWMNYYGPPATIPNVSYYRAIATDGPDQLPNGFFQGKTVFIGARMSTKAAGDRKDEFPTPHSRWVDRQSGNPFMPGVEIQATAFLNLLRGDWLNRLSQNTELAVLLICGAVAGFTIARLRPWTAVAVSLLFAVAVTAISYLLFRNLRLWFPWSLVLMQILAALLWSIVFNSVQLYVQNKLYVASLALYLSPKLVKKFASDKELLKPGAKKETLTILFSDIANFTSISEGMDSDDLARHMNLYFQSAVANCIHHTDGTIVKYIGDAIFAFWNAPDPQADHQLRACEAALVFRNLPPQYMNGKLLITRLGVHTGVANVGNFGSTARVDYTALGENINLASRMEGLNKYLGTIVLMTGDTYQGVEGRFVTRYLGLFQLKGFEKSVAVHELMAGLDNAAPSAPLRTAFATALKLFQDKKLDEAERAFADILKLTAEDGPTKFYLKHIAEMREHPPGDDWDGAVELKEK
jgi:adenylate cyclase